MSRPLAAAERGRAGAGAVLQRARTIWSEIGPRGIAVRAVQRAVPARLLHVEWYEVTSTRPDGPPAPLGEVLPGARWAQARDVAALGGLLRGEEVVRRRLAAGDRAALVEEGGRAIAHVFLSQNPYDESGIVFPTGGDTWWVYDAYVIPERRGGGLNARLVLAALRALGADGRAARGVSAIDVLNVPSRRSAARRGARVVGRVLGCTLPGVAVSRVRWTGRRPEWAAHRDRRWVTVPPEGAP